MPFTPLQFAIGYRGILAANCGLIGYSSFSPETGVGLATGYVWQETGSGLVTVAFWLETVGRLVTSRTVARLIAMAFWLLRWHYDQKLWSNTLQWLD